MKNIAASALTLAVLSGSASAAVVISSGATSHMNCSAGVCAPTAKNAVLNVSQLEGLLASSDVTVNTGSGAVTIAVSSPLTWASTSRLTLNASQGVSIKAAVVVEGTAGLTIAPSGGALNFYSGGSVTFWDNASSLIIAGNAYTLMSDLPTLASDTTADPSGFFAFAKDPPPAPLFSGGVVLTPFGGTFEGLGHTINRIAIVASQTGSSGIFATTNAGSMLRDLRVTRGSMGCGSDSTDNGLLAGSVSGHVENVTVEGTMNCGGTHVGGLVGYLMEFAAISHSSTQVKMTGRAQSSGGLVGLNWGEIDNSSASGKVVNGSGGDSGSGGLVGENRGGITDSHATGDVHAKEGAGGLVAGSSLGRIERCFATGHVTARNIAGGLVGTSYQDVIDSSFATGNVTAVRFAGGLLGWGKSSVQLTNAYATGSVTETGAAGKAGGLVGRFQDGDWIKTSWSSGAVNGPGAIKGGFAGAMLTKTPVTSGYWDLDTSNISDPSQGAGGQPDYPGITGLTTAQFQSGLPAGFDPSIWAESAGINNGYPYLIANPPQ